MLGTLDEIAIIKRGVNIKEKIKPNFIVTKKKNSYFVQRELSNKDYEKVKNAINKLGSNYSFIFLKSRLEGYEIRLNSIDLLLDQYKKIDKNLEKDSTNVDKIRKIQSIKLDLISKILMIIEDLAYISESFYQFHIDNKDICKTYLTARRPYDILQKFINEKTGERNIKKVLLYPTDKTEIDNILKLKSEEKNRIWKALKESVDNISSVYKSGIQIYDNFNRIYNKYKHGLTQIFPYACDGVKFEIFPPENLEDDNKIKQYINRKLFRDIWLLDLNSDNNYELEDPIDFSYNYFDRIYNSTIKNFTKLYWGIIQIHLNWGYEDAYLSLITNKKEKHKKLRDKLMDKSNYIYDESD